MESVTAPRRWWWKLLRARDAGEARRALLAAGLFFSVLCGYLVVKPVRDALFLHRRPIDKLPAFYLITAAVVFVAGYLVNRAAARWPQRTLAVRAYAVFGGVFLGFRAWLGADLRYGPELFMVWVSVFNLLAVYFFWSLANDLFTPEAAARLYGPVGTGGVLGSIVGATLAGGLAERLGSVNLIYVAAGFQGVCVLVAARLGAAGEARSGGADAPAPTRGEPHGRDAGWDGLRAVGRSPYLRDICAIVVLVTFAGTFLDFQFKDILKRAITAEDQKTSFLGWYFAVQNTLTFLLQAVAVAPLSRRWGPLPGLAALVGMQALTALLLGGGGVLGLTLGLALAAPLTLPVGALFYSLHQSAKELLYTPLSANEIYSAKVYVDTFGFRLGDACTALLLIAGLGVVTPAGFVLASVPFILLRGWVSLRACRAYRALTAAPGAGGSPGSGAEFKVSQ
ncbi:MAG: hypothetical protein HZA54_10275 [Planctomycetes bacterium]|nr:hypothetical protein [Planctomycetota bacterium]